MQWLVVGGLNDKGGILVRQGDTLASNAVEERLAPGAVVDEIEVKGDRLHFKKRRGKGPSEGWVTINLNGKVLVERKSINNVPSLSNNRSEHKENIPEDIWKSIPKPVLGGPFGRYG